MALTDEERAREIGEGIYGDGDRGARLASRILAAFAAIRNQEREACAKIAEGKGFESERGGEIWIASSIARAIRSRTIVEAPADAA